MVGEKHQAWWHMGDDQARIIEKPHLLLVGLPIGAKKPNSGKDHILFEGRLHTFILRIFTSVLSLWAVISWAV